MRAQTRAPCCERRWAIFPDGGPVLASQRRRCVRVMTGHGPTTTRARRTWRWRMVSIAAACAWLPLAGCTREARAVRLPSDHPNAEVYSITCRDAIHGCRDKAAELCGGEYQILQSAGAPIEPPRVSSAPGPRSTASRYQRADWVGELVVACGGELGAVPAEPAPPPRAAEPLAPELAPGQLCIPGITQLCLGPAACRGAQACLADGRGYGPCDCGTPQAADAGP